MGILIWEKFLCFVNYLGRDQHSRYLSCVHLKICRKPKEIWDLFPSFSISLPPPPASIFFLAYSIAPGSRILETQLPAVLHQNTINAGLTEKRIIGESNSHSQGEDSMEESIESNTMDVNTCKFWVAWSNTNTIPAAILYYSKTLL